MPTSDHLIVLTAFAMVVISSLCLFRQSIAWRYGFLATRPFPVDDVRWSPRRLPAAVCRIAFGDGLKIGVSRSGLVFLPKRFWKGGIYLSFAELNRSWGWWDSGYDLMVRWQQYEMVLHPEARAFVLSELRRLETESSYAPITPVV